MYKIIENRSPYFVKFYIDNIEEIKKFVNECLQNLNTDNSIEKRNVPSYQHLNLKINDAQKVIDMFPLSKSFKFEKERVAVFVTPPYGGGGIHKDGPETDLTKRVSYGPHNISFNIPIEIWDNACKTKWFDDEMFDKWENLTSHTKYSRNVFLDFTKTDQFSPAAETIMSDDCVMLINTEKWHTFYNNGPNIRKILTIRLAKSERQNYDFSSVAKKILYEEEEK